MTIRRQRAGLYISRLSGIADRAVQMKTVGNDSYRTIHILYVDFREDQVLFRRPGTVFLKDPLSFYSFLQQILLHRFGFRDLFLIAPSSGHYDYRLHVFFQIHLCPVKPSLKRICNPSSIHLCPQHDEIRVYPALSRKHSSDNQKLRQHKYCCRTCRNSCKQPPVRL